MYKDRLEKIKQFIDKQGLGAFLISSFYNILYLTGFQTLSPDERESFVLVTKNKTHLLSDGRYINEAKGERVKGKVEYRLIEPEKNLIFHLKEIINQEKIEKLGFESEDLNFIEYQGLVKNLKAQVIPIDKLIIKIREIKDNQEIENIKKACEITDDCFLKLSKTIKTGISEKEIAFNLEFMIKKMGYDLAFYPIVAINKSSAIPHYDTRNGSNEKVTSGSIILIDFGVKYQNYNSDITRTVFFGKPDTNIINIYTKLLDAQEKTILEIKKTNDPKALDQFCRESMAKNSLPNYPHSTGHGLGLEIHEFPKISSASTDIIQNNQIFTIEPGVYYPEKYGIRIEDTIWEKEDSYEILTQFPKDPMII